MDIDEVLKCLSNTTKENFKKTEHFEIRMGLRKDNLPTEEGLFEILTKNKPVGILKQKDDKFKVYYEFDEEHDIVVVISIKSVEPLQINLITIFPQDIEKGGRNNES
ncbi:hypothetical protein MFS40622_1386 [Methanocaldococcus sp. FS406-22]|uniref:hypothetical protein n=1 Tax=Methanocaldococcus sp. (strain FS406-22) TaxID=644281 RepID=UPI0001BF47F5|nr:hypothetical protein [Methanocaldococcus sp. FS406-22]ADC70062.1 hypothetical protein MFS40622_1386 [Methanocaldococcus sp. FS406-22]